MNTMITVKAYAEPPFCEKEILRYAGCKASDSGIMELLHSALKELSGKLSYKVCFSELSVSINGDLCDFGLFQAKSEKLAKNLEGVRSVLLFAATVGISLDRLIAKYGRISPARALMLQAIGAERIEVLCDAFCRDMEAEKGVKLRPRFSPGYGDLALSVQKDIFSVLDCSKSIGLYLNDSLLMSPSKSVTAFAGLSDSEIST